MAGGRSRVSITFCLHGPRRVRLNRLQVTDHVTGDIGGAPALAWRRRIPAARCNPGEDGLKAVERANETRHHVIQYLRPTRATRSNGPFAHRSRRAA